jgi:negative regulator of flagellin synthesis FlgM
MKIDSTRPSVSGQPALRTQKPSGPAQSPIGEAAPEVHLAAAADPSGAPVDAGRVAEIRQAISDGRLQIDAERIADRLIEATRDSLAREGRS